MKLCKICNTLFEPYKSKPDQFLCSNKTCKQKWANQKNSDYKKDWASKNREHLNSVTKKWIKQNPEKRKESSDKYRKAHKDLYAFYSSLRRARKKLATPIWANLEDILDVYKEAAYFGLEVDHIIPLEHPQVCGLHVWDNLQLLSRSENARKSNKFDVDVLCLVTENVDE